MTKGKKKDGGDAAGPESRGVFDDLPYADESPSVQKRAPSVGASRGADQTGHGPGAQPGDGEVPERRSGDRRADEAADAATADSADRAVDEDAPSELSEDALAEASLIVQNDLVALHRGRDGSP